MKLQNKKTGEIVQLSVKCENGGELRTFDLNTNTDKPITLAELNEEWKDYEEPKEYWCIDWTGGVNHITVLDDVDPYEENKKEIGNYFETKEEAEKAVEKLKAWKRLKDKGFKFNDWHPDVGIMFLLYNSELEKESAQSDIDLLFGGEE